MNHQFFSQKNMNRNNLGFKIFVQAIPPNQIDTKPELKPVVTPTPKGDSTNQIGPSRDTDSNKRDPNKSTINSI